MKYIFYLLFLFSAVTTFAQTGKLKGTVTDSTGNPVELANVIIENTKLSTATDAKGFYQIENIPAGSYTVILSVMSGKPVLNKITIKGNETSELNITLNQKMHQLKGVTIVASVSSNGMGHLPEVHDGVIYSGKKTEVVVLDSLDANTAQNNPRQVLGRIPGANFSETEYSGFPSDGIGFRGLNPTQSVEADTRQDGYNIAGDIYGYPESYFIPPLEAIERVEVTRGASSLQFGPQFGGVINYIVKDTPADKPIEFTTEQTAGSFGLFSSFNSIGGTYKKWGYYVFIQYEGITGWRPNSDIQQGLGFARLEYHASEKLTVGVEYSLLRNIIHMPGGLSEDEFNEDAGQSFRARNWLTTPWNIIALTSEYKVSENTVLTFKSALNLSQRNIVWRNEDEGPEAPDTIDRATNAYVPREVESESFRSSTSEVRFIHYYNLGGVSQTLAGGMRVFSGWMNREEGGPGSTGSNFDLNLYGGGYSNDLDFKTFNIAPFVENTFHIGKNFSVTPGFRFEYIKSTATGYVTTDNDDALNVNNSKSRNIALAGTGFQFKTTITTNIYANISQAYRPIEYSFLYPLGLDVNAKIDPNLKDITGYNADLGWRGSIKDYLNFDVGGFYMKRNNDIAIETLPDSTFFETNVADAVHKGIETYVEVNITKLFWHMDKIWSISFFNSFAYDDAKYVNGLYQGNAAEQAPLTINRFGLTVSFKSFSTTYLISNTAKSYADANNTFMSDPDAEVGIIPAYGVMDWSASLKINNYKIKAGINNVADEKYFTLRTNEYPGPGIIPSIGRSIYVGFSAKF